MRCAPRSGEVVNRCCGKDLGPLDDNEIPSEEDMERFSGVTRTCPECKAEVYDEATVCHNCGHAFMREGSGGLPTWAVATMAGVVVAIVLGMIAL